MFSNQEVLDELEKLDVILIKVDNTAREQRITDDLARFGRSALPTNLVYPADPDAPPIIMPEVINAKEALKALKQAEATGK